MDDRKQFREIEARLAGTLSIVVIELAELRAHIRAVLNFQGVTLMKLGVPQEEVESELQQSLTKIVSEEVARVEERVLAAIERILNNTQA